LADEKLARDLFVLIYFIAANDFDNLLFKGAELVVPRLGHILGHLLVIMLQLSDVLQLLHVLVYLLLISFLEFDPKVNTRVTLLPQTLSLDRKSETIHLLFLSNIVDYLFSLGS